MRHTVMVLNTQTTSTAQKYADHHFKFLLVSAGENSLFKALIMKGISSDNLSSFGMSSEKKSVLAIPRHYMFLKSFTATSLTSLAFKLVSKLSPV